MLLRKHDANAIPACRCHLLCDRSGLDRARMAREHIFRHQPGSSDGRFRSHVGGGDVVVSSLVRGSDQERLTNDAASCKKVIAFRGMAMSRVLWTVCGSSGGVTPRLRAMAWGHRSGQRHARQPSSAPTGRLEPAFQVLPRCHQQRLDVHGDEAPQPEPSQSVPLLGLKRTAAPPRRCVSSGLSRRRPCRGSHGHARQTRREMSG